MDTNKIEEMKVSLKTVIFNCPTSLGLNNYCGAGMKCFECWGKALGVIPIDNKGDVEREDYNNENV